MNSSLLEKSADLDLEVEIWEEKVPCCRARWFGRLGCRVWDVCGEVRTWLLSCRVKIG